MKSYLSTTEERSSSLSSSSQARLPWSSPSLASSASSSFVSSSSSFVSSSSSFVSSSSPFAQWSQQCGSRCPHPSSSCFSNNTFSQQAHFHTSTLHTVCCTLHIAQCTELTSHSLFIPPTTHYTAFQIHLKTHTVLKHKQKLNTQHKALTRVVSLFFKSLLQSLFLKV